METIQPGQIWLDKKTAQKFRVVICDFKNDDAVLINSQGTWRGPIRDLMVQMVPADPDRKS